MMKSKPLKTLDIEYIVEAQELKKTYVLDSNKLFAPKPALKAVRGVSLSVKKGTTLAIVGESGCGKSTLARLLTLIEKPTEGVLKLQGEQPWSLDKKAFKALRSQVQMVFQNPAMALNPRKRVFSILEEPLLINTNLNANERKKRIEEVLLEVGFHPELAQRYPHAFSGGQKQRIAIAKALILRPAVLVLDEPVAALDVSIQAQVLMLLKDLQQKFGLTYVFVSHNLSVVEYFAHQVLVMYLGQVVEQGTVAQIFQQPQHPYTQALLAVKPSVDPQQRKEKIILEGELPSPLSPPSGCAFNPRCRYVMDCCLKEAPQLQNTPVGSITACHLLSSTRS